MLKRLDKDPNLMFKSVFSPKSKKASTSEDNSFNQACFQSKQVHVKAFNNVSPIESGSGSGSGLDCAKNPIDSGAGLNCVKNIVGSGLDCAKNPIESGAGSGSGAGAEGTVAAVVNEIASLPAIS